MRNLTNVFLETAPSRFKLPFGINENIILKRVDNEIRRDKNGLKINKNCYMTFAAVDVEENNKILAETTFSYFNIDKPVFATKNFINQFNQIIQISQAVIPADKVNDALEPLQLALGEEIELFTEIQKSPSATAKLTKKIAELQKRVVEEFIAAITPYTNENSELVNLLVVTGTNGQFLNLPREDKGFISKMEGGRKLSIDSKYVRWHDNKDKKEKSKADDIGNDEILEEEEILVEDDNELDI